MLTWLKKRILSGHYPASAFVTILTAGIIVFLHHLISNILFLSLATAIVVFFAGQSMLLLKSNGPLKNNVGTDLSMNVSVLEKAFKYFVIVISEVIQSVEKILKLMDRQKDAAHGSSAAVTELITSLDSINTNMENQFRIIESFSSSITQISTSIGEVAGRSKEANDVAGKLKQVSIDGEESIRGTVQSIGTIEKASEKINNIVKMIQELADQTNLLALNATIEAARAGDAGKGFAVVASEIKDLANQTDSNAKEISNTVSETLKTIETSSSMSKDALKGYGVLMENIDRTSSLSQEISDVMTEQASATEELNESSNSLLGISNELKASIQNQAQANREIEGTINGLEGITSNVIESISRIDQDRYRMLDSLNRLGKIAIRSKRAVLNLK